MNITSLTPTRPLSWSIVIVVILAVSLGLPIPTDAAEFGVLSSIDVESKPSSIEIKVSLNLPMRYLNHAPQGGGDFVEIQLRPVSTIDIDVLQQRQSLPWKSTSEVPLENVIYEGNFPGTPTVVLNFSRPVSFEIKGGRDFRSIIVSIPKAQDEPEARSPAPGTGAADATLPPPSGSSPGAPTSGRDLPGAAGAALAVPRQAPVATPARVTTSTIEALPFSINLYSMLKPIDLAKVPRPPAFEGHQLYTTQATVNGKNWHRLRLGFFANAESASKVVESIKDTYPDAWVAPASQEERRQHMGIVDATTTAAARVAPAAAATATAIATGKMDKKPAGQPPAQAAGPTLSEEQQAALMGEARAAMTAGDYPRAVQLFTKILLLPPGKFSQDAQELLGLARERNGQIAHAKAEYEEYLRLYPDGPGAERVQQRLAGLLTATTLPQEKLRVAASTESRSNWEVFGSLAQFYRRDTFESEFSGSTTSQSTLFSDLNVAARNRTEDYDFRAQFTGGYDWDFLDSSDSEERISELYVDGILRGPGLSGRFGRQTTSRGGVLGRFDGGLMGYRISPSVVGNVVLGYPVVSTSDTSINTNRYFYGLSFDLGTFWDHWNFETYIIEQKAYGYIDRRAVGGELRYFDAQRSFYSLVDYDIYFHKLNTILGVGTWTFDSGTSINANIDYRNNPILTFTNAIQGQGVDSLEELRGLFTDEELKQLALDRTATSTTATLGVTHPLSPRFQVSGDVTVTNLSSTPASGGVPANPGTGYDYFLNFQFTGTSLTKTGDLGIIGLRYADLDTSNLYTLSLNTRYPFTQEFRINPRFDVIYRDNKNDSGTRLTYRPFLRMEYQLKRFIRFEADIGGDWIEDDGPLGSQTTKTYFINVGYRVDF